MTVGWQQIVTLLLVGAAVVYVTRHLLRSMSTEPGAGCGVSGSCGGCSVKHDLDCGRRTPPAGIVPPPSDRP